MPPAGPVQQSVAMSEELAEVVRAILDRVPGTDRELSREADVPASTISRIRNGTRGASREVAESVADVLARWGESCQAAETELRQALEREERS